MRRAVPTLLTFVAVASIATGTARGEDGFQIDGLEALPAQGATLFDAPTGRFLDHGRLSLGFFGAYQHAPLTAVVAGDRTIVRARLIEHRVTTEFHAAAGLFNRVELGLVVPGVPFQTGDSFDVVGTPDRRPVGAAFGDLRVSVRGRLFGPAEGQDGVGMHVALPIAFPTGSRADFTSDGTVRARPTLGVDARFGAFRAGLNAGYEFRPLRRLADFTSNDVVHFQAWSAIDIVPEHLEAGFLARGFVTTAANSRSGDAGPGRTVGLELLGLLGLRVGDWLLQFGGGASVLRGVGTPDGRAFLGFGYTPTPAPDADGDGLPDDEDDCHLTAEDFDGFEDADGCPDTDNDGDRIPDTKDRCPNKPEIWNGHQDEDGCPETDSDSDGVIDLFDQCPGGLEDRDDHQDDDGCPDPDNDGDGTPDVSDKCPTQAEDRDAFQDFDGCPDPDNDGDGLPDGNDKCPNDAENINGLEDDDGCPEKDHDLDGFPDSKDRCPELPESRNGWRDDDGCPDTRHPFITSLDFQIRTIRPVFFSYDNERVRPDGRPLVQAVAAVLKENPWITRLRIEGHTDSEGPDELNLALSEQRALVVKSELVARGVSEGRLIYVGLGEQFPMASNETPMGRIRNRRIEFHIVEINGVPVPERPRQAPSGP
jgi:outer membrane protein OmpA-like peptidoglycan-associated protein